MRRSIRSALVAVGVTAVAGATGVSVANADSIHGYPCGLSADGNPGGSYVIANCHTYAVYRRIVKANGSRGSCRYIPGRDYVSGNSESPPVDIEACG